MEALQVIEAWERDSFCDSAARLGLDEFVAMKLVYTMHDSDLDVYELMISHRLSLLIYAWRISNDYIEKKQCAVTKDISIVFKVLANYSLDMLLSKEWADCQSYKRDTLIYCLQRATSTFEKIPELSSLLNWNYLLERATEPWRSQYLEKFLISKRKFIHISSIEKLEKAVAVEDFEYLATERLVICFLRLVKMFDGGYIEGVKIMSMRVISTWNFIYNTSNPKQTPAHISKQDARCLVLIYSLYLMTIYELDEERGFVIDNMIKNIRFYYQCMQKDTVKYQKPDTRKDYTPACLIAMTCMNLGMQNSHEIFTSFTFKRFEKRLTTLFGVVSQAYVSYILGNLLIEMNTMHEEDFLANLADFKRILNLYVLERERSEIFLHGEIQKQQMQRTSHNKANTIKDKTDFKTKISKGNRLSNTSQHDSLKDSEQEKDDNNLNDLGDCESGPYEPIFQKLPNDIHVLTFAYDNVLRERTYKGWKFAKLVLLLRIIGNHLKTIAMWRYHPGLTTDFMIDLDVQLSRYYEDLAEIFNDHYFMEQEMWLTAFYLNPNEKYYNAVVRCGVRFNRRHHNVSVNDENLKPGQKKLVKTADNFDDVKFGLLSSTMDIQEILQMSNHEDPDSDNRPLHKALNSLCLPEGVVKDLLTIIFIPRNKGYTWAVNWPELRKRCKNLLKFSEEKRHLVELNMSEANERLKFLKIDYEKYKHRPQLDYGTIEKGYENAVEFEHEEEDDDDDYVDYQEEINRKKKESKKPGKWDMDPDFLQIDFAGGRRTRTRTAAAKAIVKTQESNSNESKAKEVKPLTPTPPVPSSVDFSIAIPSAATVTEIRQFEELVKERFTFTTATVGFKEFPNVWNFQAQEVRALEKIPIALVETGNFSEKIAKWKTVKSSSQEEDEEDDEGDEEEEEGNEEEDEEEEEEEEEEEVEVEIEVEVEVEDEEEVEEVEEMEGMEDMEDMEEVEVVEEVEEMEEVEVVEEGEEEMEDVEDVEEMDEEEEEEEELSEEYSSTESETDLTTIFDGVQSNPFVFMANIGNDSNSLTNSSCGDNLEINNKQDEESNETSSEFADTAATLDNESTMTGDINLHPASDDDGDSMKSDLSTTAFTDSQDTVNFSMGESEADKDSEKDLYVELSESVSWDMDEDDDECQELTPDENEVDMADVNPRPKTDKEADIIVGDADQDTTQEKAERIIEKEHLKEDGPIKTVSEINNESTEKVRENSIPEVAVSTTDDANKPLPDKANDDAELIEQCMQRKWKVCLRRLNINDISLLRQPRVLMKRINVEQYMRRCSKRRRIKRKVYFDSDDSAYFPKSDTRGPRARKPRKARKRAHAWSGSSSCVEVEETKPRHRHRDKIAARGKNLIATPSSPSGLKLRISSYHRDVLPSSTYRANPHIIDYIQIPTSTTDSDECNVSKALFGNVQDATDPLYEEEVILLD